MILDCNKLNVYVRGRERNREVEGTRVIYFLIPGGNKHADLPGLLIAELWRLFHL